MSGDLKNDDSVPTTDDEAIKNTVIYFVKTLVLVTIIFLLGYFGFSIAWVYLGTILFLINHRWKERRRLKFDIARAMALGFEKEILSNRLHFLPSWVNFPDIERVEWLNRIIRQAWARVNLYTRDFVPKNVEPVIQQYIKGFKFEKVILGHVPFRIDGIKVYEEQEITRNKIVMDLDISYAGDCNITFQVSGVKGGIENFQFRGRLRVVMKPLISKIPIIGGLQIYFMEEPEVNFQLSKFTQILSIPGLRNIIHSSVVETINSMLLFPNHYPIQLSNEVEMSEVTILEPEGVLRVHIIEARDLMKKDINIMGTGKSDPYVILTLGPKQFKTHYIENTVKPKWDLWTEFEAEIHSELDIHVWDYDDGFKDDDLGTAKISVVDIAKKGYEDLWIPLENVLHGTIHLRLTWLSLSTSPSDLDTALKEAQLLSPYLHSALLIVYLDSAQKLPMCRPSTLPDPFVTFQLEKDTKESKVIKHNQNPIWEQYFLFMIINPKTAILDIQVVDKKTEITIGELSYNVSILQEQPNMVMKNHPFTLQKSGPDCAVLCSMMLRIFKNESEFDVVQEEASFEVTRNLLKKQDSTASNSVESQETEISTPRCSISSSCSIEDSSARINLSLTYSVQRQKLIVIVHKVENIPLKSQSNLPDPYVKLYLLPGKNKDTKRKTQVIKDNCNPFFEETFEYLLSGDEMNFTQLEVTVATEKTFSNKIIGQTIISLNKFDGLAQPINEWFDLKARYD